MACVLTDAGRALLTARIKGTGAEPKYMAYGLGAGTAARTDTTLFTEDSGGDPAYARVSSTTSQTTRAVTNDTWRATATFTMNGNHTVTNVGCFDGSSGGNLFIKMDVSPLSLQTAQQLIVTLDYQAK